MISDRHRSAQTNGHVLRGLLEESQIRSAILDLAHLR